MTFLTRVCFTKTPFQRISFGARNIHQDQSHKIAKLEAQIKDNERTIFILREIIKTHEIISDKEAKVIGCLAAVILFGIGSFVYENVKKDNS